MSSMRMILSLGLLLMATMLVMAAGPPAPRPPPPEIKRQLMGGFMDERDPDSSDQKMADAVRNQVVQKLGARDRITQYKVISVTTQVVAGTNYKMKIQIGRNEYIHIKIFEPLKHGQSRVTAVESNKKRTDPL